MAECRRSELTADQYDSDGSNAAVNVDISDWTNCQDSESQSKRYQIIHAILNDFKITHNQSVDHLRTILNSGWDVNEILFIHEDCDKKVHKTALHIAAGQGCTEAVKMLLDAGAKCKTSCVLQNPLVEALDNSSTDVVRLLLKHGADPNDHDDQFENIPLFSAIYNYNYDFTEMVQLLLGYGADPNVTAEHCNVYCPLYAVLDTPEDLSATCFETLVNFGADVNLKVDGKEPVLHRMMGKYRSRLHYLDQLDFFFLHGGNISMEDSYHRTVLDYAVRIDANSNKFRWLLRHGTDTSTMRVNLVREYFTVQSYGRIFPETPLILLQAGTRVSHGTQTQIGKLETAISAWLHNDTQVKDMYVTIQGIVEELKKEEELQRMQCNLQKSTFPEYWTQQMVDLQEFSDRSLNVYPEDTTQWRKTWHNILDHIHRVQEFLSQIQSLQWYCRRCVRENLVSLQPLVVKKLYLPARLKRYILCHEI